MTRPLDLVLLWHMHQPDYRDPATGHLVIADYKTDEVEDPDEIARRRPPAHENRPHPPPPLTNWV